MRLFLFVGGCLCIVGVFSSIPGLYPLDASSTPPVVTTKCIPGYCQMSPGGKLLQLRTIGMRMKSEFLSLAFKVSLLFQCFAVSIHLTYFPPMTAFSLFLGYFVYFLATLLFSLWGILPPQQAEQSLSSRTVASVQETLLNE